MELTCPICNGAGCDECDDGFTIMTDCPLLYIGNDASMYMRFTRLFDKGMPPIAGGVLDQANKFIEAVEYISQQEALNESRQ